MSLSVDHCPELEKDQVALWLLRPESLSGEVLRGLRCLLSESELQRNARYAREVHQRRDIACRGVLRQLLAAYLGCASGDIRLAQGEHGKPHLESGKLHFNYSHSGDYAVFALCRGAEVGVDIERYRARTNALGIARSQFAPAEYEALSQLPEEERRSRFFQIWTLKEAFLKARGEGIFAGLDNFSFSLPGEQQISLAFHDDRAEKPGDWQCYSATPISEYWLALAIRAGGQRYSIVNYDVAEEFSWAS